MKRKARTWNWGNSTPSQSAGAKPVDHEAGKAARKLKTERELLALERLQLERPLRPPGRR